MYVHYPLQKTAHGSQLGAKCYVLDTIPPDSFSQYGEVNFLGKPADCPNQRFFVVHSQYFASFQFPDAVDSDLPADQRHSGENRAVVAADAASVLDDSVL